MGEESVAMQFVQAREIDTASLRCDHCNMVSLHMCYLVPIVACTFPSTFPKAAEVSGMATSATFLAE
jgi:hypothetical protein